MLVGALLLVWALVAGAILAGWSRLLRNDRAVRGVSEDAHAAGADEPGYDLSEAGWASRLRSAS